MRVLMLGWEFPPYIAGGLGTACYGLTRALNSRGTDVLFVLPRPVHATPGPKTAGGTGAGRGSNGTRVAVAGAQYEHAQSHLPPAQRQAVDLPPLPATLENAWEQVRHNQGGGAGGAGNWSNGPVPMPATPTPVTASAAQPGPVGGGTTSSAYQHPDLPHVSFRTVDVLLQPYLTAAEYRAWHEMSGAGGGNEGSEGLRVSGSGVGQTVAGGVGGAGTPNANISTAPAV